MNDDQTIFAPATAIGNVGVSVFRISGREAAEAISRLCWPDVFPASRAAVLREIRNPKTGVTIDHALVIFFSAPNSFTGEDVVEFHTHGGRAVANAVLEALRSLPRFRLAEPGEYTRRAFENGKMDLTAAEAIADLVHAETEAQRKQALRQLEGALGSLYKDWHDRLERLLAWTEASIDFVEDELPEDLLERQTNQVRLLRDEMARHLDDKHRGERLREGFSIVIVGPPNAGKSSLLNALARRDAAIVSPTAGTTRDIIEVHLDIGGYPVILADTAGLRALEASTAAGSIEGEGIRRALSRANEADLKLVLFDGAAWPKKDAATEALIDKDTFVLVNKSDLVTSRELRRGADLFLSARTGEGIDILLRHLQEEIERRFSGAGTPPLTRERHRAALEDCVVHLDRSLGAAQTDMRAEDIRLAMRSLGRITGLVDVEDLLDIVFKEFCIGK